VAVKRGLGKGLSALLPTEDGEAGEESPNVNSAAGINTAGINDKENGMSDAEATTGGEILIPAEKLLPNPGQPRKDFDAEELAELADSIRLHGIIQPVIAEDAGDGSYIIIAGERRVRAARIAGLAEVPVILRKYSTDEKHVEVALVENIQRSNLNPIEEAAAYRQLMEMEGLGQDELAAKVGKNRATVANALRLLKLPMDMQESIQKGDLSPGHARAVLSVSGAKEQEALFREIIKKGLSVREAEKRAGTLGKQKKAKKENAKAQGRPPELVAMEEKFITRLGTKVVINGDLSKGTVIIDYYSMEDLERLFEIIEGH
jgi:ParB family chromosome partitioning protein